MSHVEWFILGYVASVTTPCWRSSGINRVHERRPVFAETVYYTEIVEEAVERGWMVTEWRRRTWGEARMAVEELHARGALDVYVMGLGWVRGTIWRGRGKPRARTKLERQIRADIQWRWHRVVAVRLTRAGFLMGRRVLQLSAF